MLALVSYEKHGVDLAQSWNVGLQIPSLLRAHHLQRAKAESS
jgi:hypothetical protein